MKMNDLVPPSDQISKVAKFVLKQAEQSSANYGGDNGPYINVNGSPIRKRYDFDFISDNLEITIFHNMKPLSTPDKISEFWGDKVRIDIIGLDENGARIPDKTIKELLIKNLKEYYQLSKKPHHTYAQYN